MGPENNVGLRGCWIMECLLPYLTILSMVTVPHIMVGLERMFDYRGVGLERFHCMLLATQDRHYNRLNLGSWDSLVHVLSSKHVDNTILATHHGMPESPAWQGTLLNTLHMYCIRCTSQTTHCIRCASQTTHYIR